MAKKLATSRRTNAKKKGTKRAAKKTAGYNPHTGKPTGRAKGALERRDALIAKYIAEGMSAADARQRATADAQQRSDGLACRLRVHRAAHQRAMPTSPCAFCYSPD